MCKTRLQICTTSIISLNKGFEKQYNILKIDIYGILIHNWINFQWNDDGTSHFKTIASGSLKIQVLFATSIKSRSYFENRFTVIRLFFFPFLHSSKAMFPTQTYMACKAATP